MPFIQLHSFTNLSPPLISLAALSSFPPGEAKNSKDFGLYHSSNHSIAWAAGVCVHPAAPRVAHSIDNVFIYF